MSSGYRGVLTVLFGTFMCLCVLPDLVSAGDVTASVSFSTSDLNVHTIGEYDAVKLANCDVTREVGEPQLPAKLVH